VKNEFSIARKIQKSKKKIKNSYIKFYLELGDVIKVVQEEGIGGYKWHIDVIIHILKCK